MRKYQALFQQLEHPLNTFQIDSFRFEFSYYPATYADDSIDFQCAYLIGEIRTYTGDFNEFKAFYQSKRLASDGGEKESVGIIPIEFETGSFAIAGKYSYGPFEADIFDELRLYFSFRRLPGGTIADAEEFYLVYIAPDCD